MKNILITGGTGSLGRELTKQLYENFNLNLFTLSRDEMKQKDYMRDFPHVHCTLGDIRDYDRLKFLIKDAEIDTIFHLAALKHVDLLEYIPEEALATNVQGTLNIAKAAIEGNVKNVAFSSSDKAVAPVNTYGLTKALGEKICHSHNNSKISMKVFRWGNVLGSRGSVIHEFKRTLLERGIVEITDQRMTRFWIKLESAAQFMISNIEECPEKVGIPTMKAANIMRLAHTVATHLGVPYKVREVGIRSGEKIHESITLGICSQSADQYTDEELLGLVKSVLC